MHKLEQKEIIGIAALLIHAAKIDEIYSEKEKKIILSFVENNLNNKNSTNKIMQEAEKLEENSNQLLNYTKIIKDSSVKIKSEIIEQLWKILISDNNVDLYESNLMRRICGLIYFSDKESGEIKMTYIVKDECIKCKLTDCVEVCPVDCFYEGENMLAINPDECIDCGVCEPECPIGAIVPDTMDIENKDKWLLINKKFSAIWPNISKKKDPMEEHEKFRNVKNKYNDHFSEKPGK